MSIPLHAKPTNDAEPRKITTGDRLRTIRAMWKNGEAADIGPHAFALFVAYALLYANDQGYAWPHDRTLAEGPSPDRAGGFQVTPRTIRNWREPLVKAGRLIEVKRGGGPSDGGEHGRASVFRVVFGESPSAQKVSSVSENSGKSLRAL